MGKEKIVKEMVAGEGKEKKERKYSLNYFLYGYNHKKVVVTLLGNEKKTGLLHANEKNFFEVLLETEKEGFVLIPKHSILFIELMK